MAVKIDWKSEAIKEAAKRAVFLVITALLFAASALVTQFRTNFALYNETVLIFAIATLLILIVLDLFVFVGSRLFSVAIIDYVAVMLAFSSMTLWSDLVMLRNNIPIYLTLFLLLMSKVIQLTHLEYRFIAETKELVRVGFAVTGLVIADPKGQHPYFFLVLNKNLRGGKGLWVPPGGHFSPQFEDPIHKLREKVKSEIGVNCKIFSPHAPTEFDNDDLRTEGGEWITPPTFVLKEDLGGLCSHSHSIHIDFLYLCLTDGAIVEKNHKYAADQIKIPLQHCSTSFDATENTIGGYIDQWYLARFGRKPTSREDLTKDVVWRIFLAAKIFNETYSKETDTE